MTMANTAPTDRLHTAKLEAARRFLTSRGITTVRPLYGTRAKPVTLNDLLGARPAVAFDALAAANDDRRATSVALGDRVA